MDYKAIKIDGQQLAYRIETTNNGEPIAFNVVCASDESEILSLVEHHLNFINNPPAINPAPKEQPIDQIALLKELKAELDATKAEVAALKGQA